MTREELQDRLLAVFRDVFDNPVLVVHERTVPADVEGWDSLNTINLVVAVERAFDIRLTSQEANGFANVGDLVEIIARKVRGLMTPNACATHQTRPAERA